MLPFVKFVMNNSVHSVTGYSPFTLLYGATIGNRQTKELVALANEDTPVVSATQEEYSEWFRNRDAQQSAVLQVAQELQDAHNEKHLQSVPPESVTKFEPDEYVLVRPEHNSLTGRRAPDKFSTFWTGPYQVVSNVGSTYTLRDLKMTNKFIDKHVSNLKSFKFDPKRTNPIDVAVEDTREFFVDHIVEHTGDTKKDMMFKVRWQGYTSADDTWEPWHHLEENTFLHQYLHRNGMRNLIPPRYRDVYPIIPETNSQQQKKKAQSKKRKRSSDEN
jgi:hypothetical protein